jgi:hypothetical protein
MTNNGHRLQIVASIIVQIHRADLFLLWSGLEPSFALPDLRFPQRSGQSLYKRQVSAAHTSGGVIPCTDLLISAVSLDRGR